MCTTLGLALFALLQPAVPSVPTGPAPPAAVAQREGGGGTSKPNPPRLAPEPVHRPPGEPPPPPNRPTREKQPTS